MRLVSNIPKITQLIDTRPGHPARSVCSTAQVLSHTGILLPKGGEAGSGLAGAGEGEQS